jgi:menaquinone-dependent protoporphyrinogen oxidase
MKVLIAVASKYGSTREIAGVVAQTLQEHGIETEIKNFDEIDTVSAFGAYILGSAVYAGHWRRQAKDFIKRMPATLAAKPVWLFSSGPIGDPPKPADEPVDIRDITEITRARGHKIFAGKLDRAKLNFGERAMVRALRVPEGDFRDWDEIRQWATMIADALKVEASNNAR